MRRLALIVCIMLALTTGLIVLDMGQRVEAGGLVTDCSNDTDFTNKLAAAGDITFDCGPNPVTIILNGEKAISSDTTIDGGGKITLSGGNANRLFNMTANGESVSLANIVLTNGYANDDGGAIFNAAHLHLDHVTIQNSQTDPGHSGGAIVTYDTVEIHNSTLSNNKGGSGGAIYPRFGAATVTIFDSELSGNQTTSATNGWGGAILLWDGASVSITRSDVHDNTASFGGAIYNSFADSVVTITDSTIRNNSVPGSHNGQRGGGIYSANGHLSIDESTVSGNSSFFLGGGIYVDSGSVELTNSTVTGNQAETDFGGLVVYSAATDLTNVTMVGDSPTEITASGGPPGHLNLTNVIVAGATVKNCAFSSPPDSSSFNLSTDNSCNFGAGRDGVADMKLSPLQDNGGPTYTLMPAADSPVVDAGTGTGCPSTDQRGAPRPFGAACDVGAVEFGATPPTPTPSPSPTPSPTQPPTPTPSPSPTPSLTPTATPISQTPTPTPVVTPTPTGASTSRIWGDGDCNGSVNPVDSLKTLKTDAGLAPTQTVAGCPAWGSNVTVNGIIVKWGDIDCSGSVSPVDSLKVLKTDAGLPPAQAVANCPAMGSTVRVS